MTYIQLVQYLEKERGFTHKIQGITDAQWSVAKQMDEIENETGKWPDWNEQVTPWMLDYYGIKKEDD